MSATGIIHRDHAGRETRMDVGDVFYRDAHGNELPVELDAGALDGPMASGEKPGDYYRRLDAADDLRDMATTTAAPALQRPPAPRPAASSGPISEARILELLASHPLGDRAVAHMRREKGETTARPAPDAKEARMRVLLNSHPLGAAALATMDRAKAG